MTFEVKKPFEVIPDNDGEPLQSGYVYIGQSGFDAEASPITVYWDFEQTQVAAQPIRTINGFYSQNGSPGKLFISNDTHSIKVQNRNQALVYSRPSVSSGPPVADLFESFDSKADLIAADATIITSAKTLGFATPGDGGHFSAYFVSGSSATPNAFVFADAANTGRWFVLEEDGGYNVKQAGATGDGLTDDTVAIQSAIDAIVGTSQVKFPSGTFVVTSTLNLYKGSNLKGINETQGHASYASEAEGSKILFQPSSPLDLFSVQDLPLPAQPFKGKVSVSGLWIDGNTTGGGTNSRYCFSLPIVIYGKFSDLEIRFFQSGFNCVDTINNRFENIRVTNCTVSCVEYSGTAPPTTDVWDQCTFTDAPIGVRLASGIAIRFSDCLLENIEDFGLDVAKECSQIGWVGGYSENLPGNAAGAVFNVGSTGSTSSLTNSLQVIGGKYTGNTSLIQGDFLQASETSGVLLNGVTAARFDNLISTDVNTANFAICCSGIQYNQIPVFATDLAKISGFLDFQAVNAGTGPLAYFAGASTGNVTFTNPSTSTGTTTSRLQNDYEEGTWIASLIGSTAAPTTPVTVTGTYTKIGRQVTVQAAFVNVDTTGATGTIRVDGLPYTVGSEHYYGSAAQNSLGGAVPIADAVPGTGYLDFLDSTTTVAMPMLAAPGKYLFFTTTYFI